MGDKLEKGGRRAPLPESSLTTKEEWKRFVYRESPPRPERASPEMLGAMNRAERRRFDRARDAYHDDPGTVSVSALKEIHRELLPRVISNYRRPPGARRGAIVDGLGGVGKTTILTGLGRKYERYVRALYPNPRTAGGDEFVPVVYVTLPAETTIKGLNRAIANYYNIVVPKRITADELGHLIVEHARRCCTGVVMVDDVHFLNLYGNSEHRAVNDHMKYLANTISATFVYSGIACESTGLLSEGKDTDGRGRSTSQTRRRFSLHRVEPFGLGVGKGHAKEDTPVAPSGGREWVALLKNMERKLVLARAEDGMLYRELPEYLFGRTGGYLGSLSELLRAGARLAIEGGEERMTEGLLDAVTLDYAAESGGKRGVA